MGVVASTGGSADTVIYRATVDAALAVNADAPLTLEPYTSGNIEVSATSRGFVATYFTTNNTQLKTVGFGFTRRIRTIDLPWSPGTGVRTLSNGRAIMAFWGIYPARAAVFDASLMHLTSEIIAVPRAPVAQGIPVIAGAGDTALTAWLEFGLLRLRRMNRWGYPIDPLPLAVAGNVGYRPAMAFTGQLWLIAFVDVNAGVDSAHDAGGRVSRCAAHSRHSDRGRRHRLERQSRGAGHDVELPPQRAQPGPVLRGRGASRRVSDRADGRASSRLPGHRVERGRFPRGVEPVSGIRAAAPGEAAGRLRQPDRSGADRHLQPGRVQ